MDPIYATDRQARKKRSLRSILRQNLWRIALFILLVLAAALVLRFLTSLDNYSPAFYEPKDLEREKQLKK